MEDSFYNEAIKALAMDKVGHGRLFAPTVSIRLENIFCGDRIDIDVLLQDNLVVDLAHRVKGCLLCQASASIVGINAVGLNIEEIANAVDGLTNLSEDGKLISSKWSQLNLFSPVRQFKSRMGCVLLPFRALDKALQQGVIF